MKTVLLGNEIELIGGGTPKTGIANYWDGSIPWLSVVDFSGGSRWVDHAEKSISEDGLKNSSTSILNAGDIIISARGTVGELAQLNSPMAFNQSCYGVRAGKNLDQNYLYYLLKHSIADLQRQAHGGVFSTITRETFQHVKISLPDIPVQQEVANILGKIDEKIELNRRMNEALEKIGQALFKHYFIDNPEAKTWAKKSLDGIAEFLNGAAMQKFPADGGESLPVIKIREMSSGITNSTDKAAGIPDKYLVRDGDMLFSWSGTLIVKIWTDGDGALNQHLFKVTSEKFPQWFYYLWTKYYLDQFIETAAGKATTMGHIQRHHLSEASVLVPSQEALEDLGKFFAPVHELKIKNSIQIRNLSNLRDLLLPRLISGKSLL